MKNIFFNTLLLFFSVYYFFGCSSKEIIKEKKPIEIKIDAIRKVIKTRNLPFVIPSSTKLDTILIDDVNKSVTIKLSKEFSYYPFREKNVKGIYSLFKSYLGDKYKNYDFHIRTIGCDIEELIPNYYRSDSTKFDYSRIPRKKALPKEVIRNISKKYSPSNGLLNRNIVLWPSHGWYYENKEQRWKWQRPRLFHAEHHAEQEGRYEVIGRGADAVQCALAGRHAAECDSFSNRNSAPSTMKKPTHCIGV